MFQNHYNTEDNILYTKWIGKISLEDILQYVQLIDSKEDLPRDLRTLELFIDVELMFDDSELGKIADSVVVTIGKYKTFYSALVFNQPIPSAYGLLYQNLTETFSNYKTEVFTTQEAAKKWLLSQK